MATPCDLADLYDLQQVCLDSTVPCWGILPDWGGAGRMGGGGGEGLRSKTDPPSVRQAACLSRCRLPSTVGGEKRVK